MKRNSSNSELRNLGHHESVFSSHNQSLSQYSSHNYNRSIYSYDMSIQNTYNLSLITSTANFLTEIAAGNFTNSMDGLSSRLEYPVLSENAMQNWDTAMRFFHHGKANQYLPDSVDGDAPSVGSTDSSTNSSFGSSKLSATRTSLHSNEPIHMYPFYSYELLRSNSLHSSSSLNDDKTSSGDANSSDQDKDRKSEGDSGGDSDGQQQDNHTSTSLKTSTANELSIISDAEATASLRRQLASVTSSLGDKKSNNNEMFLPFDLSSNMSANSLTILILFLLQRNPWYGSQYLFSNVYSLLTRNKVLLDEIDLYDQAMFPNASNSLRTAMKDYSDNMIEMRQRSSEMEEESSSSEDSNNNNSSSSNSNNSSSQRIKRQRSFIQSNEVNIMRTFMTFSVSCAQQISLALEHDEKDNIICDIAFKNALRKCTESWWAYLRLYI
jgi:hypothetical protein